MLLLIFAVFLTVQCESKVNKFDFSNENDNHESIGSASKFCKIIQSNGRDKNGKKVSIIAYKIGNFYSWDANSIEYISFNGTGKREKLSDYLSSNAKNLSFGDNISELIVLGTSCYPKSKPQQEEQTAEQRAEHLAQLLDEFRITDKPIYISNIGRCKFPKKLSKAVKEAQGSLIIIAVKAKDSNTNMEEAIFNALESANGMPFNINFFSLVKEKRIPIECLLNCK
jgi:hypothetical protein